MSTDRLTCCYSDNDGNDREADAVFYIHHGPGYEDGTFSCREHLGEMVTDGLNLVQPASWSDDPAVPPISNSDWTRGCKGPWMPAPGYSDLYGPLACEIHGIDCPSPEVRESWEGHDKPTKGPSNA